MLSFVASMEIFLCTVLVKLVGSFYYGNLNNKLPQPIQMIKTVSFVRYKGVSYKRYTVLVIF